MRSPLAQARRLFLLRQFQESIRICRNTIESLDHVKGHAQRCRTGDCGCAPYMSLLIQMYVETGQASTAVPFVLDWYGGLAGIPPKIFVMCVLVMLRHSDRVKTRALVEEWLFFADYAASSSELPTAMPAAVNSTTPIVRLSRDTTPQSTIGDATEGYLRVAEMYVLQILPSLGEFRLAKEFVESNSFIDAHKKQAYISHIHVAEENARSGKTGADFDATRDASPPSPSADRLDATESSTVPQRTSAGAVQSSSVMSAKGLSGVPAGAVAAVARHRTVAEVRALSGRVMARLQKEAQTLGRRLFRHDDQLDSRSVRGSAGAALGGRASAVASDGVGGVRVAGASGAKPLFDFIAFVLVCYAAMRLLWRIPALRGAVAVMGRELRVAVVRAFSRSGGV
eukprot:Opistho-2@28475